ncbi:MAG: methyltransferase domain-containing protein [Symploca sp. SIO1A3]|nr:methyltransferase domain-containing protein [Symploca sp. SIO1A3]
MNSDEESLFNTLEMYASWEEKLRQRHETLQRISILNEHVIQQLLQGKNPIKLELGAGKERKLPGWTTADVSEGCDLILNLQESLPFPDESITEIYSSHVLEHFSYPHPMNELLAECHRILKQGGIFSICVPNAKIYVEAYLNPNQFDPQKYCKYKPAYYYNSPIDYINYIAYMAGHHYHMFDEDNLLAILAKANFRNVRLRDFDPGIDLESRKYESIYAIAEK